MFSLGSLVRIGSVPAGLICSSAIGSLICYFAFFIFEVILGGDFVPVRGKQVRTLAVTDALLLKPPQARYASEDSLGFSFNQAGTRGPFVCLGRISCVKSVISALVFLWQFGLWVCSWFLSSGFGLLFFFFVC